MTSSMKKWLGRLWRIDADEQARQRAYLIFLSPEGELVLNDLLDNVYCQVIPNPDPLEALALEARRTVVHEILENVDRAKNPMKYRAERFLRTITVGDNDGSRSFPNVTA